MGVGIVDNANATAITIDINEKLNIHQGRLQLGHINKFIDTANYVGDCINIGYHPFSNGIVLGASYPADNPTTIVKGIEITNSDIKFYTNSSSSTATQQLHIKADGRGLSQFTAKVWCKFNGIGTVGISDSHNTSSITDLNTGVYRVNFTNAMLNGSYASFASAQGGHASQPDGWSTTYVQFSNRSASNTSLDGAHLAILVFGD
jgi:hypothetical protein